MRSEASFAALCGASPVQASSGPIVRHRLNRGGDRQANNALWRIATTRMRCDQRTIEYVKKRRAEGKTRKEIIRCLKRYIARQVYRLLTDPPPTPNGNDLRCLRQKTRITLAQAATAVHTHPKAPPVVVGDRPLLVVKYKRPHGGGVFYYGTAGFVRGALSDRGAG